MYLALTANSEFWNIEDEILFLGEWCKLYSCKTKLGKLKYCTFPFVWENRSEYEKAYVYCNAIFELFLEDLSKKLNIIHKTNFSKHYYRIVLGNWLQHYIYQMYDKYITIKAVFQQYPDLSTILLDPADNIVPVDYKNFMQLIGLNDDYNLQMYSSIIKFLGYNFSEKRLVKKNNQIKCQFKPSIIESVFNRLASIVGLLTNLLYNDSQTATIVNPYFLYGKAYKLFLIWCKSGCRFVFNRFEYNYDFQYKLDFKERYRLFINGESSSGDEFYNLLQHTVIHDLPVLFLELFKNFNLFVANLPIKRTKVFFSTTSFYSNNTFKFFVAQNYKSITSIEAQHGGGNGIHLMSMEELDQKMSDYFFTFGWKEEDNQIPFIHANASVFKKKPGTKVLYVRTGQPRYITRFHSSYSGTEFKNYIDSGIRFLKHVNQNMDLMIRLYPNEEYKWFVKERMVDAGIDFPFDDFSRRFDYRLQHAYIYVSDHVVSTFLEAMAANIPTIVFCDPEITKYRKSAAPIMDSLKTVKILHDTPLSAADHLNKVYGRVDEWWNDPIVQKNRQSFCHLYARTAKDWSSIYVQTILDFIGYDRKIK